MSIAYCRDCYEDVFNGCRCENPSGKVVYGQWRQGYAEGYDDAKNDREDKTEEE